MNKKMMPARANWMGIVKFLMEFLIVCGSCRVLLGAVFLIFLFFPNIMNGSLFFWFYIGVPVALMLFGIVNLLQIADMLYMRKGILNPAIARDSYQNFGRRDRQNGRIGILFGLSGLALLFGFAPSLVLFFPLYLFRSAMVTIAGEIVLLLLLVMLYRKMPRKNVASSTENTAA